MAFLLGVPPLAAEGFGALPSAGPYHPNCAAAYAGLPIDGHGRPIDDTPNGAKIAENLPQHISRHVAVYERFDRECFSDFGQLRRTSREFGQDNITAMFFNGEPYCMAFRVSPEFVLTAGYCIKQIPIEKVRLSFISTPLVQHSISSWISKSWTGDNYSGDINDYALLKIDAGDSRTAWGPVNLERTTIPHQAVFIVAISEVAREITIGGSPNWTYWLRFSRTNSAQLWPDAEAFPDLASPTLKQECLFHKVSTFPGMSGSPIVAVHKPKTQSDPPTYTVVGIHLRNGAASETGAAGCGDNPDYNIGIRIPEAVIRYLGQN